MQFSLKMSNKFHSTKTTMAQELVLTGMCAESRAGAPLQRKILILFQHKYSYRKHSSLEKYHHYNKGGTHQPTRMCCERHKAEFRDTRRKVTLQPESFPCPEQFCASPHPEPKGCQILWCPRAPHSSAELSVIDTRVNLMWMGEYGHTLLLIWCYWVTSQLFQ